jgi:hypothetical protein
MLNIVSVDRADCMPQENVAKNGNFDSCYLFPWDVEAGISIELDDENNLTLLKSGRQVAWFSARLSEEAVTVFIGLIKIYEHAQSRRQSSV